MRIEAFSFPGASEGRHVRGRLVLPDGAGPFPFAIFVHGYTISCEWGFWPELSRRLAARGVASLRFNASGDGFGEDLRSVLDLDAVAQNTYGKELLDLAAVRAFAHAHAVLDPRHAAIVGHSRGGAVSVIHADEDRRYAAVALWAASDTVLRFSPSRIALWRARGTIDVTHFGLGRRVVLHRDVLDEVERDRARYDVLAAMSRLDCPVLVLHGALDRAVSISSAHALARAARHPRSRLLVLDDAGHSFGAREPLVEFPERLTTLLQETVGFLTERLGV